MTHISRVRVSLTGLTGLPGVSTFYFLDTSTAVASLITLWTGIVASMPAGIRARVESAGDVIEDTTGDIVGTWGSDPVSDLTGGVAGAYSAPSGGCLTWTTAGIVNSHRVRGRTFMVPLDAGQYQSDGTLADSFVTGSATAGNEFITEQSTSFVVWSRPFAGRAAVGTHPAIAARAGSNHLVTGCRVTDKAAVLRSRRD